MALIKVNAIDFDDQMLLRRIRTYLIPGERLFFIYDCRGPETDCIGLTDRRLLFQDNISIPGIPMLTSLPLESISSVRTRDSGRIRESSKVLVMCKSQTYAFEFRSHEKAHNVERLILRQMHLVKDDTQ